MRLVELGRSVCLFKHEPWYMLGIHQLVFCRTKVRLLLYLLTAGLHREWRGLREDWLTAHSVRSQRPARSLLRYHKTVGAAVQHVSALSLLSFLVLTLTLA